MESLVSQKSTVEAHLLDFAKAGLMPPIIVTPTCMEYLTRQHNLLRIESVLEHSSVEFEPNVSFKTSTGIESQLDINYLELEADISNIEFQTESIIGEMSSYMDKTVLDLTTSNDMAEIIDKVNDTLGQNHQLMKQVHDQKNELDTFKIDVSNKITEQ